METIVNSHIIQSLILTHVMNAKFNALVDALDEMIEAGGEHLLTSLNQALASPENLSLLIKGICGNINMLENTVAASYYHENGFHKIVLLAGRSFKLRLHHFGATAKIPMENIHDHRWCFASTILYGDLKMDLFQPTEPDSRTEKTYWFIYEADKTGGCYKTDFVSVAHLRKSESRTYKPGSTYLMRTHELHRIRNSAGQESVTLLLTGKPESNKCNLYSRRMILEQDKKTIPYHKDMMVAMLEALCERVFPQKN